MCLNQGPFYYLRKRRNGRKRKTMSIEKLKKRYPDGFDPERSIHRPEYERKEQTESASTHLFNMRNKAL